jgi:hypothetical protein
LPYRQQTAHRWVESNSVILINQNCVTVCGIFTIFAKSFYKLAQGASCIRQNETRNLQTRIACQSLDNSGQWPTTDL